MTTTWTWPLIGNRMQVPAKQPTPLVELNPGNVELADLERFRPMTGWFGPKLLGQLLWRAVTSDLFGKYADRRLIVAALDRESKEDQLKRADLTEIVAKDEDGAVWIDYVADLGDGFDATYSIAFLLAQPFLKVWGKSLPRGNVLIMGGDQVYPIAEGQEYSIRMRKPYSFAFAGQQEKLTPLLVLPGNHDWYDGLARFLANFAKLKPKPIGNWLTRQTRSYFAAKITENWWVWGIDIALVHDMDQPQHDYFVNIAQSMPAKANIILCSAEPGWYKAEKQDGSYSTLSYAAWIAENTGKAINIPLVLSGDSHHYARYVGEKFATNYITSGGGGAFLHGTLELKDRIEAKWLKEHDPVLLLKSIYPSKEESSRLLDGNHNFFGNNPEFSFLVGAIYCIFTYVVTISNFRIDTILITFCLIALGLWGYSYYQEKGNSREIIISSLGHATADTAVILLLSWVAMSISKLIPGLMYSWYTWLGFLASWTILIGGLAAGIIHGWYLIITCRKFNININDAFSAIRLDSHKNFLRIRMSKERLTIYPIKIERSALRGEWRENMDRSTNPSLFVADPPLSFQLIELPIVVSTAETATTRSVKTPSELPLDKKTRAKSGASEASE